MKTGHGNKNETQLNQHAKKRVRFAVEEEEEDQLRSKIGNDFLQDNFSSKPLLKEKTIVQSESDGESNEESDKKTQINKNEKVSSNKTWKYNKAYEEEESHLSNYSNGEDEESENSKQKITPFNMKEENDEGTFDDEGNYTWNFDREQRLDDWLLGISKKEISRAKLAKEARQHSLLNSSSSKLPSLIGLPTNKKQAIKGILSILLPTESVYKALSRLGTITKISSKSKSKNSLSKSSPTAINNKEETIKIHAAKQQIEQLTANTSFLFNEGQLGTYERLFEDFLQEYYALFPQIMIYYRWSTDNNSAEIFGPFPLSQILDWYRGGIFNEKTGILFSLENKFDSFHSFNGLYKAL